MQQPLAAVSSWWQLLHILFDLLRYFGLFKMTPSTNPTEQHVDKQQQRSIISSFLREEVDELMASGLMPRPSDLQQVHKDVMPVMAVYLPCPTTPTHRVQWPLPSPQETNASGDSLVHNSATYCTTA